MVVAKILESKGGNKQNNKVKGKSDGRYWIITIDQKMTRVF